MQKISEKINAKLKGNAFIYNLKLTEIALGEHSPRIQGVRVITDLQIQEPDLPVFLELDVTYNGGSNIALEATLAGGVLLKVKVYLKGFAGKLRVRCPSLRWSDSKSFTFKICTFDIKNSALCRICSRSRNRIRCRFSNNTTR